MTKKLMVDYDSLYPVVMIDRDDLTKLQHGMYVHSRFLDSYCHYMNYGFVKPFGRNDFLSELLDCFGDCRICVSVDALKQENNIGIFVEEYGEFDSPQYRFYVYIPDIEFNDRYKYYLTMCCGACGYSWTMENNIYIIESKWGMDVFGDISYTMESLYFICPKKLTETILEKGTCVYKKHINLFPNNIFETCVKKNDEMLYPIVSDADDIIEVDLSGWYSKYRYKFSVYMEMINKKVSIYTEDNIDPIYLRVYKDEEI